MRYSFRAPSFLIVAVVVFTSAPTFSVHPTIGQEVKSTSWERFPGAQQATTTFNKLLAKLEEPTKLEFFESPLDEVVQEISDLHNVLIRSEKSALEELGIDSSEPVTFEMENVKLGTALSLMLDDLGLVLSARDNVFLFTTTDAERELTRVYHTSGLVHADDNCDGLIETIMKSVQPESWEENGGDGTVVVYQRNLVISQSFRTHIGIVALLNELRDNIAKAGGPKLPKAVPAAVRPAARPDPRGRGRRDGGEDLG